MAKNIDYSHLQDKQLYTAFLLRLLFASGNYIGAGIAAQAEQLHLQQSISTFGQQF
jgi:hypothetical protein